MLTGHTLNIRTWESIIRENTKRENGYMQNTQGRDEETGIDVGIKGGGRVVDDLNMICSE